MMSKLDKGSNILFVLLISADVFLVVLHILHIFANDIGIFRSPWFSVATDRGFAESYTYIKEYWIVLVLVILSIKRSKGIYFLWSLFFVSVLIDDSYRVHEKLGSLLKSHFDLTPIFGLRTQDIGELCVYVFAGMLFLIAICIAYYRSDIDTKLDSRFFLIILALLAFFAVCVDMISMIARGTLREVMVLLEDGGEMFAVSVMLWFVLCLVTNKRCRLDICDALHDKTNSRLIRRVRQFVCCIH